MPLNNTIKRELEVAFSKKAQPVWVRVLKYVLLGVIVYLFWGSDLLWIILIALLACALLIHFWVRYKPMDGRKAMDCGSMIKTSLIMI